MIVNVSLIYCSILLSLLRVKLSCFERIKSIPCLMMHWGWFKIKISCEQYRKSQFGNKTILCLSYLCSGIPYTIKMTFYIEFLRPQLVVHAVYHQVGCSRCGQLDVKYSDKVDISVDKIFMFYLFFLGFFSVCLLNIYFNVLEYLSILDLLSFDKNDP